MKKTISNLINNNFSYIKFWLVWIFVIYIWYLLYLSLNIIYLIFAAFVISIAMEWIIKFFSRFFNRWIAILISYLIVIFFIILSFLIIIPFIINQTINILKIFIDKALYIQEILQTKWLVYFIQNNTYLPWHIKSIIISNINNQEFLIYFQNLIQQNIANIINRGTDYVKNVWIFAINFIKSFLGALFQIILIFVFALFFSLEKNWVLWFINKLTKLKYKEKINKIYDRLWFWIQWQIILWIFIWFSVYIWLLTLKLFWFKISNIETLALIAWITEIFPVIWPIIWFIPIILVWTLENWLVWFLVLWAFYLILQFIESNILVPLVMKQALGVSSLLVLIMMALWWIMFWIIWVILAVPLSLILTILFED